MLSHTVQTTPQLLPSSSASSVETANLIWVNQVGSHRPSVLEHRIPTTVLWVWQDETDFVLYEDMERLWYKYNKQLDVACVLSDSIAGGCSLPTFSVHGLL